MRVTEVKQGQIWGDRSHRTEQVSACRSRDHQTLQETDTTSLRSIQKQLFIWKCTNTAFISSNFNFIESSQEKQLNIKMWLPQWLTEYRVFRFNIENTRSKSESNLMHVPKPTLENENRMNLHTEEEEKLYRNFWFETNFNTEEQQVTHWIKHN